MKNEIYKNPKEEMRRMWLLKLIKNYYLYRVKYTTKLNSRKRKLIMKLIFLRRKVLNPAEKLKKMMMQILGAWDEFQ